MDSKNSLEIVEKVDTPSQDRTADLDEATRRAERKLRTKIDLYIVPTVALLYLMCFIDRANIGERVRDDQRQRVLTMLQVTRVLLALNKT
jgi:hypothetical protein